MIVYESEHCKISPRGTEPSGVNPVCCVSLNASSFGYACRNTLHFIVSYDPTHANFNLEKPTLPTYYETPRSTIFGMEYETEVAPAMEVGYSSEDMRSCVNKDFPEGYHRIAWDYPPFLKPFTKYIHPDGKRLLHTKEVLSLYGCGFTQVQPKVLEYLKKQVEFFERKAWGDQSFNAYYDRCASKFKVAPVDAIFLKTFDFTQYTPLLCHPVSDRYPGTKGK